MVREVWKEGWPEQGDLPVLNYSADRSNNLGEVEEEGLTFSKALHSLP